MSLVIKTDGTVEKLGDKPELHELQKAVGGCIAMVMLEEPRYDGALNRLSWKRRQCLKGWQNDQAH